MLTIENINDTKVKEFSFLGREWILYGVDVSSIEYKFIFMPMDNQKKIYDLSKPKLVILNRYKKFGEGYRLWTTDGISTYITKDSIKNWKGLVEVIWHNKMLEDVSNKKQI